MSPNVLLGLETTTFTTPKDYIELLAMPKTKRAGLFAEPSLTELQRDSDIQLKQAPAVPEATESKKRRAAVAEPEKGGHITLFSTAKTIDGRISLPLKAACASMSLASENAKLRAKPNPFTKAIDPRRDDLKYAALIELRRNGERANMDRYVPDTSKPKLPKRVQPATRRNGAFPFERLPDRVQSRILALLIVSPNPIELDFTWLRPFFTGHARVPSPYITVEQDGVRYRIPKPWNQVVNQVDVMQDDLVPFKFALEERADKARPYNSPCAGLTTSLLRVSRAVHKHAAHVFYEQNTFCFLCPTTAWMFLESFLITIGSTNVAHIRSLQIHVPLWHHRLTYGYIEGAILDLASPASRLAITKLPARDRLLAAVEQCVFMLQQAGQLTDFEPRIQRNARLADKWIGRVIDDTSSSMLQANEHEVRKQKGIELLKQLTESLPNANTPTLDWPA
ncbi:hypothetical protein B0A55_00020 [Friedmanniomyces simplex]|uniref:Uncharacterized protein n=1 Tax=Friedmanniomyces simplex TaxID=329884 RepID=A0A4U0Y7U4_9PEZI|nr:hypothetical protein B0A55_00020 [Friedmanniomyces simplex]